MDKSANLYVIATPIGNLEDITVRALRIMQECDLILCEDTRVTKRLLDRYDINKKLVAYHQHSKLSRVNWIKEQLLLGASMALVSDAGTPGISDPGNELISQLLQDPELFGSLKIIPIPGPSALAAIASVAGINMSRFCFFGFPPHKKGREKFFKEIAGSSAPAVYFESPHRLLKNLDLLDKFKPECQLIIGRELTKIYEEIVRGTTEDVRKYYTNQGENKISLKGELVIISFDGKINNK